MGDVPLALWSCGMLCRHGTGTQRIRCERSLTTLADMARTGASECVQCCNSCMNDNSNYRQRYNDSTKSIDNQTSVNHGRWQAGANEPIDHLILRSIVECAQAGGGVQRFRQAAGCSVSAAAMINTLIRWTTVATCKSPSIY